MSFIVELASPNYVSSVTELLKQFNTLRDSRREDELRAPEWKTLEKAYLEHLLWRFKYPKKVFGQRMIANWLITVVVLALVVAGLVFSFIQLTYAIHLGDISSLATSVQIETAGKLSISSSVVGAITLVISLAFFALYLKYVFQIRYPVPPHVGISDTDAASFMEKAGGKKEPSGDVVVTKISNG
jgi:hypothetical protein